MSVLIQPIWIELFGLATLLVSVIAVQDVLRGRWSDGPTVRVLGPVAAGGMVMWLLALAGICVGVGWPASAVALAANLTWALILHRGLSAILASMFGSDNARSAAAQADEAAAVLLAMQNDTVQQVLHELHITEKRFRELYHHLRGLGFDPDVAGHTVTDPKFLRQYFSPRPLEDRLAPDQAAA